MAVRGKSTGRVPARPGLLYSQALKGGDKRALHPRLGAVSAAQGFDLNLHVAACGGRCRGDERLNGIAYGYRPLCERKQWPECPR